MMTPAFQANTMIKEFNGIVGLNLVILVDLTSRF